MNPTPLYVKKSPIHGFGTFTKQAIKSGQTVRLPLPTCKNFFGLNHSCEPNAVLVFNLSVNDFVALALRDIPRFGELTVTYGKMQKDKCNCPTCGRH